ncbi:Lrp/AsnC family transcriptional regulator [Desulforhopalus vacuolatus]|uniref:Lrp/AsnC family transcriptional regulator n=1 Tax=Desulforhopalus vacuolatus TaxID=40414 RepID=UPI0019622EF5|nr:Lrp/AsnC family transcriptional regulator [Desulforhopalus vacuolatus]MBM9519887.1 Lrp/AsnC family transcriptional regulator [Desulforhopalus vacuolatus]
MRKKTHPMITSTDKKIIKILQKDGRASYSDIAQNLGITPSTAAKRAKYMLEHRTITVRAMLNPYKLGLIAGAFIAIRTSPEHRESLQAFLNKELFVSTILSTPGRFDIFCLIRTPSWEGLHDFISSRLATCPGVLDYDVNFISKTFTRFQIFGRKKKFEKTPDLKEVDWQILHQLCLNGRQSNSDIAEKLDLHVSTVSRRIQEFLSQEYIRILPHPNPTKFDYASSVVVQAWVDISQIQPICEMIGSFEEVFMVFSIINRPAIIFGVHTGSNDITTDLINYFLSVEGLKDPIVALCSRVIKSNCWWNMGSLN